MLAALQSIPAAAEKRVALIIGNSAYQNTTPLQNPRNDAEDVAARLTGLGFQVVRGFDLSKAAMDSTIAQFLETVSGADVAVFFYGGHGLQVGGQNYLVPIDAKLQTARALDFETVRLELVQRGMDREAKTNILFLDACRDNPLARNLARALGTRSAEVPRGLAPVKAAIGTVISFSTQPGNVALDGKGRNSPFAEALVAHLGDTESITDILMSVRNDVVSATNQQQVPWEHSALRANFFFAGPPVSPAPAAAYAPPAAPSVEQQAELELWSAIDAKSPELLQAYLDQYPTGRFAGTARMMADLMKKEQEQAKLAEQRQADARRAEEEKRVASAQAVEAQQKAQAAKRDSDYRLALEEARKARALAEDAERRRIAAEQAAAQAQTAAEAATAAREEKAKTVPAPPLQVAALSDEAVAPSSGAASGSRLSADVQRELKRVACYGGEVDGTWDDSSRSALEAFAKESGTKLAAAEPALDVLNVLKRTTDRVCSVARAAPDSKSGSKKAQRGSGRTQQKAASKSRSRGRDCTPIYGPYGAHPNPWCK